MILLLRFLLLMLVCFFCGYTLGVAKTEAYTQLHRPACVQSEK
jgi:hypothetical protein